MAYLMKSQDVFDFASVRGEAVKQKGNELWFKHCPYCGGGRGDEYSFSVNLDSGAFKCFRASCGKQGHFVELCRDFEYKLEFENGGKKEYRRLPQKEISVTDSAIEYLKSRGISAEVTRKYKITTTTADKSILVFPFYDENNVLQFVKYRKANFKKGIDKNKEWSETDTRPILFGMAQCEDFSRLVITEGQIDSLSLAEAGIKNAVSVPTGAMGFTWLNFCWDWISKFERVIVFGDNENGKITLVDELSKRLPKIEVVDSSFYLGEKDANDILRRYGKDALVKAVESAKIQPVKRIKSLADVKKVNLTELPKVLTGIKEIDRAIGGIYFGQVVLLTGKRGDGKSTFMSQLIAETISQGYRALAYSGELTDYHFKAWLDMQIAGGDYIGTRTNEFGDAWYFVPTETAEKIENWYRDKVYIYDNNSVLVEDELEGLLETIEQAVARYDINLVCIDNLMTALDIDISDDLNRSQSKFVHRLKLLAVRYNVAVVLVAHPRKTPFNSKSGFQNDDVSGSSDITNRVDVVLNYSRAAEGSGHDSEVIITKNRLTGTLISINDPVKLLYSKKSKRIYSMKSGSADKRYGWEVFDNGLSEVAKPDDFPW